MTDILIRNLSTKTVNQLKARAKKAGRSLQTEVRRLLEETVGTDRPNLTVLFDGWKERFKGRSFSKSLDLLRLDRSR